MAERTPDERVAELEAAIRQHRSQRARDIEATSDFWAFDETDAALYAVIGEDDRLPSVGAATLTSTDPEPEVGTAVTDDLADTWVRVDGPTSEWLCISRPDSDPESWTKIAGNYGPVTVRTDVYNPWSDGAP